MGGRERRRKEDGWNTISHTDRASKREGRNSMLARSAHSILLRRLRNRGLPQSRPPSSLPICTRLLAAPSSTTSASVLSLLITQKYRVASQKFSKIGRKAGPISFLWFILSVTLRDSKGRSTWNKDGGEAEQDFPSSWLSSHATAYSTTTV